MHSRVRFSAEHSRRAGGAGLGTVPRYVTPLQWEGTCCNEVQRGEFRGTIGRRRDMVRTLVRAILLFLWLSRLSISLSHCVRNFDPRLRPESVVPSLPAHTRQFSFEENSTATQVSTRWVGRSAAQVALPPLSLAQLACPALSALLLLLHSQASDFSFPCVVRKRLYI